MSNWKDDINRRKENFCVFRDAVDLQMKWVNHCVDVQAKLIRLESDQVDLWMKYQKAIGREISLNQAKIEFQRLLNFQRQMRYDLAFFLKMGRQLSKVYDPDSLTTASSRHVFWQAFTFCTRTVGTTTFWSDIREMELTSQQLEDSYSIVIRGEMIPWQWEDHPWNVFTWVFALKEKRIVMPYTGSPAGFLLMDIVEKIPSLVEQRIIELRRYYDDETNRVYGIWHPEKHFGV